MLNIEGFLDLVYKADAANKRADAIDMVFITFDDLAGDWSTMNDVLAKLDVTKISASLMCTFLTQTFKYSDIIPNHSRVVERMETELLSRGETQEMIKKLFQGLRNGNSYWDNMKSLGVPEWITGKKP